MVEQERRRGARVGGAHTFWKEGGKGNERAQCPPWQGWGGPLSIRSRRRRSTGSQRVCGRNERRPARLSCARERRHHRRLCQHGRPLRSARRPSARRTARSPPAPRRPGQPAGAGRVPPRRHLCGSGADSGGHPRQRDCAARARGRPRPRRNRGVSHHRVGGRQNLVRSHRAHRPRRNSVVGRRSTATNGSAGDIFFSYLVVNTMSFFSDLFGKSSLAKLWDSKPTIIKDCGVTGIFPEYAANKDVPHEDELSKFYGSCGFLGFNKRKATKKDIPRDFKVRCGTEIDTFIRGKSHNCLKRCSKKHFAFIDPDDPLGVICTRKSTHIANLTKKKCDIASEFGVENPENVLDVICTDKKEYILNLAPSIDTEKTISDINSGKLFTVDSVHYKERKPFNFEPDSCSVSYNNIITCGRGQSNDLFKLDTDGCLQKNGSDEYFYLNGSNQIKFGAKTCKTKFELKNDMNDRTISLMTQDGRFCSTDSGQHMGGGVEPLNKNEDGSYTVTLREIDNTLSCIYDKSTNTTIMNVSA